MKDRTRRCGAPLPRGISNRDDVTGNTEWVSQTPCNLTVFVLWGRVPIQARSIWR
jgi:hypothetical protein